MGSHSFCANLTHFGVVWCLTQVRLPTLTGLICREEHFTYIPLSFQRKYELDHNYNLLSFFLSITKLDESHSNQN